MPSMRLDDRITSYKSFLDYEWVRRLAAVVPGTGLEKPVFVLLFNWKATANAFTMPALMMDMLKSLEHGYLRQRPGVTELAVRALADALPQRMAREHGLSNMKQRQLSGLIRTMLGEMDFVKDATPMLDPQALFDEFLHGPGGSELQLGVFGLAQTCYGSLFHTYENFVTRCISIAKGEPDYRPFKSKTIEKDIRAAFGDEVAEFCLTDDSVQVARSVRNALAHNGGVVDPTLEKPIADKLGAEFFVEDGVVLVVAANVHNLFNLLKLRVGKIVDKALTMPQFQAPGAA